jgi:hypothetical protein
MGKTSYKMKMIRRIIAFALLGIVLTLNSSAQDYKKLSFQIDMGATVSIPNQSKVIQPTNQIETSYLPCSGYFGELLGSFRFTEKASIQSGINYNFSRQRITDKIDIQENKGRIKKSYLQVPILLKYRISNKQPFNIGIGFYIGFLLQAEKEGGLTASSTIYNNIIIPTYARTIDMNIKSSYHEYDYGISFQTDYELSLKNQHALTFLLRCNYGLTDITSEKSQPEVGYKAVYTRNISLYFGVGYRI